MTIYSPIRGPISRPHLPANAASVIQAMPGLLAWWDAGVNSGTTWVDRKAGRVMTVTGAAWSATSFNGSPGWTFDGTDDYMNLESQPFPSAAAPSEMFVVFQQNTPSGTGTNTNIFGYGTTGNSGRTLQRISGNVMRAVCGTGAAAPDARDNTNTVSSRHVVHAIYTATDVSISVDGNAYVTTAAVPSTGTTRVRIGASLADTPAGFFSGIVRDVIVTGALSAAQRSYLQSFLLSRRAL